MPEKEPQIPRNPLAESVDAETFKRMMEQAQENEASADVSPGSVEPNGENRTTDNKNLGPSKREIKSMLKETAEMEKEFEKPTGEEKKSWLESESPPDEPNVIKRPTTNNPNVKPYQSLQEKLMESGTVTPRGKVSLEETEKYVDSPARLEQYAQKVQQKYNDTLAETGGNFVKASQEAKAELERLVAGNKELKDKVSERFRENLKLRETHDKQKGTRPNIRARAPENLPMAGPSEEPIGPESGVPGVAEMPEKEPPPAESGVKAPISSSNETEAERDAGLEAEMLRLFSEEKSFESEPVESEEERNARVERETAAHEFETRGGAASPEPSDSSGEKKEPELAEKEEPMASEELISQIAQEGLELYQSAKSETGDALGAYNKATEYIIQKLERYNEMSFTAAWLEMRGNIPDSELGIEPEPEPSPEPKEPSGAKKETEPSKETLTEQAGEVINIYNQTVDTKNQQEFNEKYHPIRFGVTSESVMARRRDGLITPPDFKTAGDGDFFAVPMPGSENRFFVIPRFNVTIQEINYLSGGMVEVFDAEGFDPRERYHDVKVEKPAIFELDTASQTWKLIEKGRLNLKPELAPVLIEPKPEETPQQEKRPSPEEEKQIEAAEKIGAEAADAAIKEEETAKPPRVETEPLTAEEIKTINGKFNNRETIIQDVEALPEKTKEKLGLGLGNLGFFIEANKNKVLAGILERVTAKTDNKGTAGRFISSLAENFRRDEEIAQKRFEAVKQGQKQRLANSQHIFGNLLKYGRVAADFIGWTAASQLRYVTMGAMFFARGSEAAKEARLKNEELIEKNRYDENAAVEEATKIYQAAQAKSETEGREVLKEDLEKAYRENLPQSLIKRLESQPQEKSGLASRIAARILDAPIMYSATVLERKISRVESDEKLTPQEKEQEKEKLFAKYSKRLKDYDRMLGQYGAVDSLAMAAKYGEVAAKSVVAGVMVESAYLSLHKLWENLAGAIGEKPEPSVKEMFTTGKGAAVQEQPAVGKITSEVSVAGGFRIEDFEKQIQVDSKDGLTQAEASRIIEAAEKLKSAGNTKVFEEIHQQYRNQTTTDTKRSILDLFQERSKIKVPPQFDRPLEDIVDSSRVGVGSDSVWKSTKEIFLYRSPADLKKLGFDVPIDDPEFGAKLNAWADKLVGNLIEQWKHAHGGRSPDIVHNGDRVRVEFDTENKLHMKILNAQGEEIEPSSFAPPSPRATEGQVEPTDEEIKELENKLQKEVMGPEPHLETPRVIHPITGEDLGPEPHPELHEAPAEVAPAPPTPAEGGIGAPTSPSVGVETQPVPAPSRVEGLPVSSADEFKTAWGKTEAMPDWQKSEEQFKLARSYMEKTMANPDYKAHKIWGEELDTLARMFTGKGLGFAEKLEDIATPTKLAEVIDKFEKQITDTTRALVESQIDPRYVDSPFPVTSADGEHLYFAQPGPKGKWGLMRYNQTGTDFEYIKNPGKFFGSSIEFSVKDIKKLLGYK